MSRRDSAELFVVKERKTLTRVTANGVFLYVAARRVLSALYMVPEV